jgi:hypothetical protein
MRNDHRISHSAFRPELPDWEQGKIHGLTNVIYNDHLFKEEFLDKYSEYEVSFGKFTRANVEMYPNMFVFSLLFNHHLICEFDFLDMIGRDNRIRFISFYPFVLKGGL